MNKSPSFDRTPNSRLGGGINPTPAKDAAANAAVVDPNSVVSLVFGYTNVGSLADFGCTHGRIRGRLYVTTDSILFYSNLLGFETRITVLLADVLSMELCR